MIIQVNVDNIGYYQKPVKREIIKIRKRMANNWYRIDLAEFADMVGNKGRSFTPGCLTGGIKADNCVAMQLLVLDFDHGTTFQMIKERCELIGLNISFAYHTFSSSEAEEKFRIVFVHEYLIDDPYIIKIAIHMLQKIFPECDPACKNLDRLFLGGKELIYMDNVARIALMQVYGAFFEAISKNGNRSRNVDAFCNTFKIYKDNRSPAIGSNYCMTKYSENDEIRASTILHKIEDATNSSFFVLEAKVSTPHAHIHKSNTCEQKLKRTEIKSNTNCQLLNDFNNGESLSHNERFLIYTNMLQIKGGQSHFFEILSRYYHQSVFEKWKKDAFYMNNYKAQRCSEENCPYYLLCDNKGTIVDTLTSDRQIRYCRDREKYLSLEEAYDCLCNNLKKAIESNDNGIHLIKAQTALGKTNAYISYISEHKETRFLIAVPTVTLKNEIYKRLISTAGVCEKEVFMTLSTYDTIVKDTFPPEIIKAISDNHNRGIHWETKTVLKKYLEILRTDNSELNATIQICEKILKGLEAIKDERIIVTTHASLLQMPEKFLNNYTVIIDEDIWKLHISKQMKQVSLSSLEKIEKRNFKGFSEIASIVLQAEEGKYIRFTKKCYGEALKEKVLDELEIYDNVNDMLSMTAFVKMKEEGCVNYFAPSKLPDVKCVILSATLNAEIYQQYFSDRMVYTYPEQNAAYIGRLIQYTYHSLSRIDLEEKNDIFDILKKRFDSRGIPFITFKKYEHLTDGRSQGLHYGNTAGIDEFAGKDIVVIGTPFGRELDYKLIACYLGTDVNTKEDSRPRRRRIDYNGFSFVFTTYSDQLLRTVQLHDIQSELEQTVGRARLLRKNCTVYLFSSFPCEQARIYTDNYLLENGCDSFLNEITKMEVANNSEEAACESAKENNEKELFENYYCTKEGDLSTDDGLTVGKKQEVVDVIEVINR
ncbi:MAG: hypothetical protein LIP12_15170 [Clostridiales bacterium]|nr:hypothetical protein [Clostridiales bacterium]